MKKQLLLAATAILAISTSALNLSSGLQNKLRPETRPDLMSVEISEDLKQQAQLTSRAEADEAYYSLAGDPMTAIGIQEQDLGWQFGMAFQIDPTFIASLTNGEITGISYYTGAQNNKEINTITSATVFITDNLTGNYLYEQKVTDVTTEPFAKVDVRLDTPFSIPAGKKIYVGVYCTLNSANDMPVVCDNAYHTSTLGGWLGYRENSNESWAWDNITSAYGFVTVGAKIKSSTFPENSVSIVSISGQPVATQNEPFSFNLTLQNNGVNTIRQLTIDYGVDGDAMTSEDFTLDQDWTINQHVLASIEDIIAKKATKSSNVTVKISAINGQPNTSANAVGSYPITIVPAGTDLPRNVVIEEFTSTSCPSCPVGYTAMETIHEEATDGRIIPVCIHVNVPNSDPLTSTTFGSVFNNYSSGSVPSSTINRTYSVYPVYDNLMQTATAIRDLPGIAKVWAEASLDKTTRKLTIKTKSSFAFDYSDGDKSFILSFGITQNDLGPYAQQNGYSGSSYEVPGGWQSQPSSVKLIYNNVARQLDRFSGIKGSIPTEIKAGQIYEYTHEITLLQPIGNNYDNINVIVYLLNASNGQIENACILKSLGDGSYAGIEPVIDDFDESDVPVEYYNLQGVRVSNPAAGIFIRRQGNKVSKVLLH